MAIFNTRNAFLAAVTVFILGAGTPAQVSAQTTVVATDLVPKGEWDAATNYITDDIVTTRGSTWRAKRNNVGKIPGSTSPNSANDWELFARGFNPLGAWSSLTTYQVNDLVSYLGTTWRARRTNTNKTPQAGANWEQLAEAGAPGATGATGPQGPPGPNAVADGSAGAPSFNFSSSANTGMFSPSTGKVALTEGGTLFLHNIGTENTALGFAALDSNTTGFENTALGVNTLTANTTGQQNTAIGASALAANTTGGVNTAMGSDALLHNTTGINNTAVGVGALLANTTASQNSALGRLALGANTTGALNTAVGYTTLRNNTTGAGNTAVGVEALLMNTTASQNTAVGTRALHDSTGNFNVAVGSDALRSNTTAGANTALGFQALYLNETGASNTAVGWGALFASLAGGNTAVGVGALGNETTGSNNTALGFSAGSNANGSSNGIFISNDGQAGDNNTIRIGTQGTQTKTFVAGIRGITTGTANAVAVLIDSNGQLGTTSSSRRYKFDIATMADVSAMLAKLRPVTFRYKQAQDGGAHPLQYGLIAEEVADVFADLAVFKDGAPETVKYHLLPSFLLAGCQAQQKTIAAQADKIDLLEERLRKLEALLPQTKAASLQ